MLMLTKQECLILAEVAEHYPTGVDQEVWGYGPLKSKLPPPTDCPDDILEEYG